MVSVQEVDLLDPDGGRRRALLAFPDQRHLVARGVVETAGVTARHDEVRHVDASIHPTGYGAGGTKVDIVGMREHG